AACGETRRGQGQRRTVLLEQVDARGDLAGDAPVGVRGDAADGGVEAVEGAAGAGELTAVDLVAGAVGVEGQGRAVDRGAPVDAQLLDVVLGELGDAHVEVDHRRVVLRGRLS